MRQALGDSDDVMTDLMYTLTSFIAILFLCKSVSGLYHSNAALFVCVHM